MVAKKDKPKVFVRKGLVVSDDVEAVPLPPSVPEPEEPAPKAKGKKAGG